MNAYDHFGKVVQVGDRVEIFRVHGGSTGGDALGWKGGIPGTVRELGGPCGSYLVELDERAPYAPPRDVKKEWADPRTTVRIDAGEA